MADITYLNTPANGIVPQSVIDWRRGHDISMMENPQGFRSQHGEHLDRVRSRIAQEFSATQSFVGLIPNFSSGLNILLEGLPKEQRILMLKNDYPSITWPVKRRGFSVDYAIIDENLEDNIAAAVAKYKPDVFIFSVVQWLNGIKIDFEFLKQLKAYNPNLLLIADATQYLGTERFNFQDSAIDVIAASSYKWLLGGFGNGFILVKPGMQSRIHPKSIGFNSAASFGSEMEDTSFIKHFEPGHLDTLNFGSLEKSLEFVENYGKEVLYKRIADLSLMAKERFSELGLLDKNILHRKTHSTIFNLKVNPDLIKKLEQDKISCSPRGGGIRVGFHFYNSEEDLEKLVESVRRL